MAVALHGSRLEPSRGAGRVDLLHVPLGLIDRHDRIAGGVEHRQGNGERAGGLEAPELRPCAGVGGHPGHTGIERVVVQRSVVGPSDVVVGLAAQPGAGVGQREHVVPERAHYRGADRRQGRADPRVRQRRPGAAPWPGGRLGARRAPLGRRWRSTARGPPPARRPGRRESRPERSSRRGRGNHRGSRSGRRNRPRGRRRPRRRRTHPRAARPRARPPGRLPTTPTT